ncbi:hypothetical protein DFP73DRAFT_524228 [Morchella snyderi]|nr:hypothetical protein DFP73DRAFT_524228 [Morchella snyderi]
MPLWYHPPPVLVEEGGPSVHGGPINPPLYYHPPPICVDPSEDAVIPSNGTTGPALPISPPVPAFHGTFPPQGPGILTGTSSSGGSTFPIMPGMYPVPFQGDMSSYTGFKPAEEPKPAMVPQPVPRVGTPGTPSASPHRFGERVYYYDDETNEVHVSDPETSSRHRTNLEQLNTQAQTSSPHITPRQYKAYYIDENTGKKITISPNTPRAKYRSRRLELTREGSGEFEVKLWHEGGDHTCKKKVRVFSGPGGVDDVDIDLSDCRICQGQEPHEPSTNTKADVQQKKRLEEKIFKDKIRQEEYAKMKADEKLKLEIRKELQLEDAQRQESARLQNLEAEKRANEKEAERRVVAEAEKERIQNLLETELKKRNAVHLAELEAEKESRLQMERVLREEAKQYQLAVEMQKVRNDQLVKIEEERRKEQEDKVREEAKQREILIQVEQEKIRREICAEFEERERIRLAEVEAEKKKIEVEAQKLQEETKNFQLSMGIERERLADLAKLAADEKRKIEGQKVAAEVARQSRLNQERSRMIEEINRNKSEQDRIRAEEWEKVRAEEIKRMREEIRKELSEQEARRIADEQVKTETFRLHQLELDRNKLNEQIRIQLEAGREEIKKQVRNELEKEEEMRSIRLQAEYAALKAKVEAEAYSKEQAQLRSLAEAHEKKRVEAKTAHEESIKRHQREQAEAAMRKHAQAQAVALEQERLKKLYEAEAAKVATMAAVAAEENEMRRIIRAEIKEDMRKSRGQNEAQTDGVLGTTSRLPAHRNRVQQSYTHEMSLDWFNTLLQTSVVIFEYLRACLGLFYLLSQHYFGPVNTLVEGAFQYTLPSSAATAMMGPRWDRC